MVSHFQQLTQAAGTACESLNVLTKVIYDGMRYSIEVFMAPWSGNPEKNADLEARFLT